MAYKQFPSAFLCFSAAFLRDLLFSTAVLSLCADFLSCLERLARVGSDRASTEIKLRAITPPGFVGYENDHTLFLLDFLGTYQCLSMHTFREFLVGFIKIYFYRKIIKITLPPILQYSLRIESRLDPP